MINCRQLGRNFNVFTGLYKNFWLLGILAISALAVLTIDHFLTTLTVIGGQILIVFFGGTAFDTTPISPIYWAVSVILGAGSLAVGALVRLIPDAPLGQLLIWLRVMPDLESLPRTRPPAEKDDEKLDGKPFRCKRLAAWRLNALSVARSHRGHP